MFRHSSRKLCNIKGTWTLAFVVGFLLGDSVGSFVGFFVDCLDVVRITTTSELDTLVQENNATSNNSTSVGCLEGDLVGIFDGCLEGVWSSTKRESATFVKKIMFQMDVIPCLWCWLVTA